ncbi:hypothetical protein B0H16DRAFT_1471470 [Mycena metata]|uniref:Uncharacterized protein n=1 Tax=Mycena metata TaxID=1033252 RepID=A0AAD7HS94_9AGAR|nr:hypothetical protein B0H16DRAFT_1471470 [Mycena metata]
MQLPALNVSAAAAFSAIVRLTPDGFLCPSHSAFIPLSVICPVPPTSPSTPPLLPRACILTTVANAILTLANLPFIHDSTFTQVATLICNQALLNLNPLKAPAIRNSIKLGTTNQRAQSVFNYPQVDFMFAPSSTIYLALPQISSGGRDNIFVSLRGRAAGGSRVTSSLISDAGLAEFSCLQVGIV